MNDFLDGLRAAASAALLPDDGELAVGGLEAPVEVLYDRWGVPYVTAVSLEDLWFAQGFLAAGERLFQLDLLLRAANGRLAEVFADPAVEGDRFARVVGWNRAGARIAASFDDRSRAMVGRFVDGVFAWIDRMPEPPVEYVLLDVSPELPREEAAWAAVWAFLAWNLSGNMSEELLRTHLRETYGEETAALLMPPFPGSAPSIAAGGLAGRLLDDLPLGRPGLGSNNWVVAGSRTATGKPLLANDPHLMVQQPAAWLEFHLRAPGYEARGVALPFSPGIAIGTTAHHAWGVTNVTGDVQDLYVERLSEEGTAARFGEAWEPLIVHREEIFVRGSKEPVVVDVRETRHGPILESYIVGQTDLEYRPLNETYALRWTGHEVGVEPSAFLRAATATSFEEFRDAVRPVRCPGQNFVYADVDGHIGYQCTGQYPLRRKGDGTVPVPGWNDEYEWDGWVPFEELPWAKDPERGYLVTANNRIHDDGYHHLIGMDFHAPFRAVRIAQLIEEHDEHTVGSTRAIQTDTVSLAALEVLARLPEPPHPALGRWDGDLRADSRAAALFNLWVAETAARVLPDDALRDHYLAWREPFLCAALPRLLDEGRIDALVLKEAAIAAIERLGSEATTWGDLHTVRFTHPLGRMPGLEPLFVAAEIPLGGDEQTVLQGAFDARLGFTPSVVASWRAVFDLADLDRSVGVLTTGQSGNPASRHWNDQAALWGAGEYHALPFSRPAVEAAARSTLRLIPGVT